VRLLAPLAVGPAASPPVGLIKRGDDLSDRHEAAALRVAGRLDLPRRRRGPTTAKRSPQR